MCHNVLCVVVSCLLLSTHQRGSSWFLRRLRSWPWIGRWPSRPWCTSVRAEPRSWRRGRAAERWSSERDTPVRELQKRGRCEHHEQFHQNINKSSPQRSWSSSTVDMSLHVSPLHGGKRWCWAAGLMGNVVLLWVNTNLSNTTGLIEATRCFHHDLSLK